MSKRIRVPERARRLAGRRSERSVVALTAVAAALVSVSVVGAALGLWDGAGGAAKTEAAVPSPTAGPGGPAVPDPRTAGGAASAITTSAATTLATAATMATSEATTAAQALSANTTVPTRGTGTRHVLAVPGADSTAAGRTVRYTVEVEGGTGVDEAGYARLVRDVLADARGWETQDQVHFVNVSPEQVAAGEQADVRITLATPETVDELCAPMATEGRVSCSNGEYVALNAVRWEQGVPSYPDDLLHYRIYLINHEVGHAIGHDHEACPGPGRPAPVMLQQTLGLDGCTRYPWPVPGQNP